jgi:hypothetical protein
VLYGLLSSDHTSIYMTGSRALQEDCASEARVLVAI